MYQNNTATASNRKPQNSKTQYKLSRYQPSIPEVKDALDFADACFLAAAKEVHKQLLQPNQ